MVNLFQACCIEMGFNGYFVSNHWQTIWLYTKMSQKLGILLEIRGCDKTGT